MMEKNNKQLQFNEISELNAEKIFQNQSWQNRYTEILRLAKGISSKPEIHSKQFEVEGCSAKLWLDIEKVDTFFYFRFDSESRIIKGLFALVLLQWQAKPLDSILAFDSDKLFKDLGLTTHLSPSRSNSLLAAINSTKNRLRP